MASSNIGLSGSGKTVISSLGAIFLFLCLFLVVFLDLIYSAFNLPGSKWFDDLVLICLSLFVIANIPFLISRKVFSSLLILMCVLLLLSVVQGLYAQHFSLSRAVFGMLYFVKPIIFFLGGCLLSNRLLNYSLNYYLRILKVLLIFGYICCILNYVAPELWWEVVGATPIDDKYRLTGAFPNAGRASWLLAVTCTYCVWSMRQSKARGRIILIFALVTSLFFLSLTYVKKSMLSALVGVMSVLSDVGGKKKVFVISAGIAAFFPLLAYVYHRMLLEYDISTLLDNPRYLLGLGAIKILLESELYFLFGAGFGTWGGYVSSILYSPYYVDLGFSGLWGFEKGASSYTGDNYLAHVIAEVGIIGTIIWAWILALVYRFPVQVEQHFFVQSQDVSVMMLSQTLVLLVFVESIGISALEISTVSFPTFFFHGLVIGKMLRSSRVNNI